MAITIDKLAKLCHVSRGTVDRALHNRGAIDGETKQRILKTAKEYGYTPNYLASSLARGKSGSVGVIVFDLNNRFFTELVSAMEAEFRSRGIFSYICLSEKQRHLEKQLIEDLMRRRVDGIALLPINEGAEFEAFIRGLPVPVVAISNRLGRVHHVGADEAHAVYCGMDQFSRQGYRTVHFVCPPIRNLGTENLHTQLSRLEGYRLFRSLHPEVGGEEIISGDYLERVLSLASRDGERPGFFCSSDHYALKIFRVARERKLPIPEAFGLMGFDGMDNVLNYLEKKLTTIHYPASPIGECAARTLDQLIIGEIQPEEQLLPCALLPGDTV